MLLPFRLRQATSETVTPASASHSRRCLPRDSMAWNICSTAPGDLASSSQRFSRTQQGRFLTVFVHAVPASLECSECVCCTFTSPSSNRLSHPLALLTSLWVETWTHKTYCLAASVWPVSKQKSHHYVASNSGRAVRLRVQVIVELQANMMFAARNVSLPVFLRRLRGCRTARLHLYHLNRLSLDCECWSPEALTPA